MLYTHNVDPLKSQVAYHVIVDALSSADMNRAEAIVGLLCVLGTQFNGGVLDADIMSAYVQDACDWYNTYFMPMQREIVKS